MLLSWLFLCASTASAQDERGIIIGDFFGPADPRPDLEPDDPAVPRDPDDPATVAGRSISVEAGILVFDPDSGEKLPVFNFELRRLIDRFAPVENTESALVIGTHCYSGDTSRAFIGRENTAVFGASEIGEEVFLGGFHVGAAAGLRPAEGTTSANVFVSAFAASRKLNIDRQAAGETESFDRPAAFGPDVTMEPTSPDGPLQSRHILVHMGDPFSEDRQDLRRIRENFSGQFNTTVTAVGAKPILHPDSDFDHPGTHEGLINGLQEIAPLLNPNEQFIFFIGDHGILAEVFTGNAPGEGLDPTTLQITPEIINRALAQGAEGLLTIGMHMRPGEAFAPDEITFFASTAPSTVIPDAFSRMDRDVNLDGAIEGTGEGHSYYFEVSAEELFPTDELPVTEDGLIEFSLGAFSNTGFDVDVSSITVSSDLPRAEGSGSDAPGDQITGELAGDVSTSASADDGRIPLIDFTLNGPGDEPAILDSLVIEVDVDAEGGSESALQNATLSLIPNGEDIISGETLDLPVLDTIDGIVPSETNGGAFEIETSIGGEDFFTLSNGSLRSEILLELGTPDASGGAAPPAIPWQRLWPWGLTVLAAALLLILPRERRRYAWVMVGVFIIVGLSCTGATPQGQDSGDTDIDDTDDTNTDDTDDTDTDDTDTDDTDTDDTDVVPDRFTGTIQLRVVEARWRGLDSGESRSDVLNLSGPVIEIR
ncbi:MAG: hypothetical protein AAFV53_04805 [Myxococcota bacterium]